MTTTSTKFTLADTLALIPDFRASLKSLLKSDRNTEMWFRETGSFESEERGTIRVNRVFSMTLVELVRENILSGMQKDLRRAERIGSNLDQIWVPSNEALTLEDVARWYTEGAEDTRVTYFPSKEALDAKIADEKRAKLESFASSVAKAAKVSVNSLDFIKAVNARLAALRSRRADFNNPEARMERYGACVAAGVRDVYHDDNNFENGRFAREEEALESCLTWLAEQCPLLWAKHQEQEGAMATGNA